MTEACSPEPWFIMVFIGESSPFMPSRFRLVIYDNLARCFLLMHDLKKTYLFLDLDTKCATRVAGMGQLWWIWMKRGVNQDR